MSSIQNSSNVSAQPIKAPTVKDPFDLLLDGMVSHLNVVQKFMESSIKSSKNEQ
jgi:hypothetical protein